MAGIAGALGFRGRVNFIAVHDSFKVVWISLLSLHQSQCPRIGKFGWKMTPYKQQFSTLLYKFERIFHSFS